MTTIAQMHIMLRRYPAPWRILMDNRVVDNNNGLVFHADNPTKARGIVHAVNALAELMEICQEPSPGTESNGAGQ